DGRTIRRRARLDSITPDERLLFHKGRSRHIFIMNLDGTSVRRVTRGDRFAHTDIHHLRNPPLRQAMNGVFATAADAAVVTDTFTGSDGTLLQNHVGETGATWTKHSNYPANFTLASNRVYSVQWAMYTASGVPATNEYDVSADLTVKSNAGATGGGGRAYPA